MPGTFNATFDSPDYTASNDRMETTLKEATVNYSEALQWTDQGKQRKLNRDKIVCSGAETSIRDALNTSHVWPFYVDGKENYKPNG
jgi:hypothetical protein